MRKLVLIVVVAISNGCVDSPPPSAPSDGLQQRRPSAVRTQPVIMVYEKGKGLLRLEQKRGGKTAMTWTLDQFTPGRVTEE